MTQTVVEEIPPKATVQTSFEQFMELQRAITDYNQKRAAYDALQGPAWQSFEQTKLEVEGELRSNTAANWSTYRSQISAAKNELAAGLKSLLELQLKHIPEVITHWEPEEHELYFYPDHTLESLITASHGPEDKEEQRLWENFRSAAYKARQDFEGAVKPKAALLEPKLLDAAKKYEGEVQTAYHELSAAHNEVIRLIRQLCKSAAELGNLATNWIGPSFDGLPRSLEPRYALWSIQNWPTF